MIATNKCANNVTDDIGVTLCTHCHLPVGNIAYTSPSGFIHGECMAQTLLQEMKDKEDNRFKQEKKVKAKHRAEYDIGWKIARIPSNLKPAARLGANCGSTGMVCLVYNENAHTVQLAAALE